MTQQATGLAKSGAEAGLHCYHTDAAGSVVAISKAAVGGGPVVATYSYGPFGEQTGSTGSHPLASRNPLRYRGYYADAVTGLYYLPARYYDPGIARFLSKDPAPPQAGDPRSLNAHAYCQGDPVNASDPSGAVIDRGGAMPHIYRVAPEPPDRVVARLRGTVDDPLATVVTTVDGDRVVVGPGGVAGTPLLDTTPFGRDNMNWAPTRPSDVTWGGLTVGVICDSHPAGILVSSVVDSAIAFGYYNPRRHDGDATFGDVAWTAVSALPYVSTMQAIVYGVWYDDIDWAEPNHR